MLRAERRLLQMLERDMIEVGTACIYLMVDF